MSKLANIFHKIVKCICPTSKINFFQNFIRLPLSGWFLSRGRWKLYFSKLKNAFHQILKCISPNSKIYISKFHPIAIIRMIFRVGQVEVAFAQIVKCIHKIRKKYLSKFHPIDIIRMIFKAGQVEVGLPAAINCTDHTALCSLWMYFYNAMYLYIAQRIVLQCILSCMYKKTHIGYSDNTTLTTLHSAHSTMCKKLYIRLYIVLKCKVLQCIFP